MDVQVSAEEFSTDETEVVVKSAIGSVLTETTHFKPDKIDDWSNSIISATLKGLQSLNRPYKYVITVILMQKNGAGLVSAASTFWDEKKDGLCKVLWENSMTHCIVTVFALSLNIESDGDDQ